MFVVGSGLGVRVCCGGGVGAIVGVGDGVGVGEADAMVAVGVAVAVGVGLGLGLAAGWKYPVRPSVATTVMAAVTATASPTAATAFLIGTTAQA
jgi:hypothetical protein